jgi:YlmC/YmxH family sporulation protein
MRLCELREKEVINACDCKRLGFVADLSFDPRDGVITDIIVPGPGKVCGIFGTDSEYVIPWDCIQKIGPDLILVEVIEEKVLQKF